MTHRLDGATRPPPEPRPPSSGTAPDRAEADTLHKVNSALLARLRLSLAHREALKQRGLTDEAIDARGYRTFPVQGRYRHAKALREELGDVVLRVPGFVVRQGNSGPYVTLAGAAGMLVPVRDLAGRVVAGRVWQLSGHDQTQRARRGTVTDQPGGRDPATTSTDDDGTEPEPPENRRVNQYERGREDGGGAEREN